jgi:hypothetical protein
MILMCIRVSFCQAPVDPRVNDRQPTFPRFYALSSGIIEPIVAALVERLYDIVNR